MGKLVEIFTPLHKQTTRNYLERMNNNKVECMEKAKKYGKDYWDGERKYGYGGYRYINGWWNPVARELIDRYHLADDSKILDIGCGKGYLLYELQLLNPKLQIFGIDKSDYAIANRHPNLKGDFYERDAANKLEFKDKSFDLVISTGTLHNLKLFQLSAVLPEIQRVGKNGYIMVESYRNNQELFNLQCWALTAETFLDTEEWIWLFNESKYTGDYEFIYFS